MRQEILFSVAAGLNLFSLTSEFLSTLDIENVQCRFLVALDRHNCLQIFSGMLAGSTCSSDFGPETFFLQTVLAITVFYFMVYFLGSVAGVNELCEYPWACNTGSDLQLPFAVSLNSLILHASYVNHKFIV